MRLFLLTTVLLLLVIGCGSLNVYTSEGDCVNLGKAEFAVSMAELGIPGPRHVLQSANQNHLVLIGEYRNHLARSELSGKVAWTKNTASIAVWGVKERKVLQHFLLPRRMIKGFSIHPTKADLLFIWYASEEHRAPDYAEVWNVLANKRLRKITLPFFVESSPYEPPNVRFSPDGKEIVAVQNYLSYDMFFIDPLTGHTNKVVKNVLHKFVEGAFRKREAKITDFLPLSGRKVLLVVNDFTFADGRPATRISKFQLWSANTDKTKTLLQSKGHAAWSGLRLLQGRKDFLFQSGGQHLEVWNIQSLSRKLKFSFDGYRVEDWSLRLLFVTPSYRWVLGMISDQRGYHPSETYDLSVWDVKKRAIVQRVTRRVVPNSSMPCQSFEDCVCPSNNRGKCNFIKEHVECLDGFCHKPDLTTFPGGRPHIFSYDDPSRFVVVSYGGVTVWSCR